MGVPDSLLPRRRPGHGFHIRLRGFATDAALVGQNAAPAGPECRCGGRAGSITTARERPKVLLTSRPASSRARGPKGSSSSPAVTGVGKSHICRGPATCEGALALAMGSQQTVEVHAPPTTAVVPHVGCSPVGPGRIAGDGRPDAGSGRGSATWVGRGLPF